jgi:steroid 5-alpha reductase family enzyme
MGSIPLAMVRDQVDHFQYITIECRIRSFEVHSNSCPRKEKSNMIESALLMAQNFAVIMAVMILLWLISIQLGDVSFIDSFWAFGFVIIAWATFLGTSGSPNRSALLLGITTVWGLRLSGYLFWRWRKEGADGRYVAMKRHFEGNVHLGFLRNVFLMQGVLLWLVSVPIQLGQLQAEPAELGFLALLGSLVAMIGIAFESIGDAQLASFKGNPDNAGLVMDKGLWRYTRHPNYFGDLCVWWGLFLIAAETSAGKFSIFGPALMTWILVQWSGATLLERRMKRSRPGYEDYVERSSRFFPMPPRNKSS